MRAQPRDVLTLPFRRRNPRILELPNKLTLARSEIQHKPFNGRAPLTLIATDGRFGAEIVLLYLRALLRKAMLT
jgi:hypothetical protein